MGKAIASMLAAGLVVMGISGIGCARQVGTSAVDDGSVETTQAAPAADEGAVETTQAAPTVDDGAVETTQAAPAAEQAAPTTTNAKYQVTIDGGYVSQDYAGQPVLVVQYTFTNNSDKAASFTFSTIDKAYQNGVQLEGAYAVDGMSDDAMKEVKPGVTLAVEHAFVLDDYSPVTVEVKELISFTDELLAEKVIEVA